MIGAGLLFRFLAARYGLSNVAFDVLTPGSFESLGCGALLAGWMACLETEAPPWGGFFSLFLTELSRSLLLTWVIARMVWGIPGPLGAFFQSHPMRTL